MVEDQRAGGVAPSTGVPRSNRYVFSEAYEDLKMLREELLENREVLKDGVAQTLEKIDEIFGDTLSSIEDLERCFKYVETRAHEFDLNETTRGNGYWSMLLLAKKLVREARKTVHIFTRRKNTLFFGLNNYLSEIQKSSRALMTIASVLEICTHIMMGSHKKGLIQYDSESFTQLLDEFGKFDQFVLFGKFNSIQLLESHGRVVRLVSRMLTAYSEMYYGSKRPLTALWRSLKVILSENQSALRSVVISQYAPPSFFKDFMSLTESGVLSFIAKLHQAIAMPVSVNTLMSLEPKAFKIVTKSGDFVEISVPMSHIGPSALPVRLLSRTRRSGMENSNDGPPPSDELVLHFHGGGFMGHTSKSHEGYLRSWARQLNCTVASVDYSLSPEVPYPRPVEEAFFAYCYALKHPRKFGWTGKKIVLTGDSAGGLLVTCILIEAIQLDIRLPDGTVMIYTPFIAAPVTSPGRLLVILDPVISIGFLANSSKCYTNRVDLLSRYMAHEEKMEIDVSCLKKVMNERAKNDSPNVDTTTSDLEQQMKRDAFNPVPFSLDGFGDIPTDPYLSPLLAGDEILRKFPPVSLVTCEYDPFIDDNVEFAKRLTRLGVRAELTVLEGLNHAFLNLCMLSGAARKGRTKCCQLLSEHLRRGEATK